MNKRITVCAMGDSITRGIGMPEGAPCWVEVLERRFDGLRCVNLSHGGESSRQALAKLDALSQSGADIVTLQYGMNDHYMMADGGNNVPEAEFRRNMERLIRAAGKARVILITNHPIIEGDDERYYFHRHPRALYALSPNEWINRYNGIVRELAESGGHRLADMWEIAARYPAEDFLRSRKNTPLPSGDDGVHPHLLGGRVYAETVGRVIEEILKDMEGIK